MNKFKSIFLEKNKIINLISKNDESFLEEKHIFDSLSIQYFFEKYGNNFETLLDIGTGGGFPALPIAIKYPDIEVIGLDSIRKKINAIQEMADTLKLKNFSTICDRAENLKGKSFSLITARAVARLKLICEYALPLLKKEGYLIVYKSKLANEEISEAEPFLKSRNAKVIDVIEYKLSLPEIYERNLVVVKRI